MTKRIFVLKLVHVLADMTDNGQVFSSHMQTWAKKMLTKLLG